MEDVATNCITAASEAELCAEVIGRFTHPGEVSRSSSGEYEECLQARFQAEHPGLFQALVDISQQIAKDAGEDCCQAFMLGAKVSFAVLRSYDTRLHTDPSVN